MENIYKKIKVNGGVGSYELTPIELKEAISLETDAAINNNHFKGLFNKYIDSSDKNLTTMEIFIKYSAYKVIAGYLKKCSDKNALKIIEMCAKKNMADNIFNYVVNDAASEKGSQSYARELIQYILKRKAMNNNKIRFFNQFLKNMVKPESFIIVLNEMYVKAQITDRDFYAMIKDVQYDYKELVFMHKEKRTPFMHYLYLTKNIAVFNMFYNVYGKGYDKKYLDLTIEEYIEKNPKNEKEMGLIEKLFNLSKQPEVQIEEKVTNVVEEETKEELTKVEFTVKEEKEDENVIKNFKINETSIMILTKKKMINVSFTENFEIKVFNEHFFVIKTESNEFKLPNNGNKYEEIINKLFEKETRGIVND